MYNNLDEIKAAHTGHWFDKDTCRFFQSRFSGKVYPTPNGAYFISSERGPVSSIYQPARMYTVRFCDANGDIHTIGDFMQYATSKRAHGAAKRTAIADNAKPKPRVLDYDNPIELWVCVDCIQHAANGECGGCHEDEHEGGEPLSLIPHDRSAMGLAQQYHSCRECEGHESLELGIGEVEYCDGTCQPKPEECDCEYDSFSTASCDGCGSYLHGERHAMIEWPLLNN